MKELKMVVNCEIKLTDAISDDLANAVIENQEHAKFLTCKELRKVTGADYVKIFDIKFEVRDLK